MFRFPFRVQRMLVLAALLLFAGAAMAQLSGDLSKVEPLLRVEALRLTGQLPGPVEKAGIPIAAPAGAALPLSGTGFPPPPAWIPPSLFSTETVGEVLYLDTFIALAPGADTSGLTALGVRIGSRSGDIVTADIPIDALSEVNALPEVRRIEGSRFMFPTNDQATTETGVQTVWTNTGNRGAGAVVGVIDSGIDWMHQDFKNNDGSSRVQYIWDMQDTGGPPPPAPFNRGTMWTKAQIDSTPGSVRERDDQESAGGHGTHVAGTAAGNGRGTGNGQPAGRFAGVASEADIIFCKYDYTTQGMVDAASWIYDRAAALQKPCAINLSQGNIAGPHDGSTLVEQNLSNLVATPGRAFCIAAGNSGEQPIHAMSTLIQDTGTGDSLDDTPVLAFWAYPADVGQVQFRFSVVEFFYPAGSNLEWRPVYPGASGPTVGTWITGAGTNTITISGGDLDGITVQTTSAKPYNDGRNLLNYGLVVVESPAGKTPLNGYPFYIQLKGPGVPVQAWHIIRDQGAFIPAQVFINSSATPPAKLIEPDDSYTVGAPGTADGPICVGSYVTKVSWTDVDGQTRIQSDATLGAISGFSSRGPRRDGNTLLKQQKPDIAAPGEALISTLSSSLTQRPRSGIERDGVHQKMQGTSMACPVACGITALMLAKNPALTNAQIKGYLRQTARDAGAPGWDPIFGAGKIDAAAAIAAVPGGARTAGDVNNDGMVNTYDAILVRRHLAGLAVLTGEDLTAADYDDDGGVDIDDVDGILGKEVGL